MGFVPPVGQPLPTRSAHTSKSSSTAVSTSQPVWVGSVCRSTLGSTKDKDAETKPAQVSEEGWEYPDTPMTRRWGHLRGTKRKKVAETVASFYQKYTKVILPQYRPIVTEYLQSTHLMRHDARFEYNALFGAGFHDSFMRFINSYPAEGQKELIYKAVAEALELDPEQMKEDSAKVAEWAKGKTEEDVFAAMKGEGESSCVSESFVVARTGLGPFGEGVEEKGEDVPWFSYNRPWAIGIFDLMSKIGLEPTDDLVEKWFGVIGIASESISGVKDLALYTDNIAKIEQAEQLFKEIEIREKKRLAERLEEKAANAIKEAERAEKEARDEEEERLRIANAKEGDVLPNDLPKDEE
ncbi:unnamed protein product [Discosporangium mesarthrocarpum]